MSAIRFNFAKFDKAVAFQILEQDPDFTGKKYLSSNGILLQSNIETSIDYTLTVVGLRGSGGNPLKTIIHYFNSDVDRDNFYNNLLYALDEFSKNKDKWEPITQ